MALAVVVFDVGETLVDEATTYARWEAEGVSLFAFAERDLHPDVLPCFAALRELGLRLGAAGNMCAVHEEFLRAHVDFVGSSEHWGVEKPDGGFFEHVGEAGAVAAEIVYVGDRVDNDVEPAVLAGIGAVRIGRGAHAHVESPPDTISVASLSELPEALARV